LITAAQHHIEEHISALAVRVRRAGRFHLMDARQRYARLSAESSLIRLRDAVNRRDQRLDEFRLRIDNAMQRRLRTAAQELTPLIDQLRRQNIGLRISVTHRRLQNAAQRLHRAASWIVNTSQTSLNQTSARLEALSPLAVLSRGYALVYAADGTLLYSVGDTAAGQTIRARLARGMFEAEVLKTITDKTNVTETNNS
jgi:exodeoxyribonuclease VII large subunit